MLVKLKKSAFLLIVASACIFSLSYAQDKENQITPEEEEHLRLLKEEAKFWEEYLQQLKQLHEETEKTRKEIKKLANKLEEQIAETDIVKSILEDVFKSKLEGIENFEVWTSYLIASWVQEGFSLAEIPTFSPHEFPWGVEKTFWDLHMTFIDSLENIYEGTCRVDISEKEHLLSKGDRIEGYRFFYQADFNNCNFHHKSLTQFLDLFSIQWISKNELEIKKIN